MIKEVIKNINIINHDQSFFGDIFLEKNKIVKIAQKAKKLNPKTNYCLPAFIDQHNHGGYGINFDNPEMLTLENFNFLKEKLKAEGVGKILFTTVSQPVSSLLKIGIKLTEIKNDFIAGWQIEGPFIDTLKKGAHDEKVICEATFKDLEKIDEIYPKKKLVVIHPSENHLKVIKKTINSKKNYWFSIGHSNANYNQAFKGIEAGCTQFTHLFNAMSQIHHRNPGAVFAALADQKTYVELIGDNMHLSNDTLHGTNLICKPERIILISDCLWVKGLKDGFYKLGSLPIEKIKNHCYLKGEPTLAGGAMKYIDIVRNYYQATKASFEDLVKVTSYNSAKQFKIKNSGIIKKNMPMNFIVVDKNLNLIKSYIK